MPLLQQDNGRGGGGSRENRRSFVELTGLEASQSNKPAAAPIASHSNEVEWRWDMPGSPEAAQTPRSLVPSKCFPPHHPMAFTSYSERARPGSWAEPSGQRVTDLVASLKSLEIPQTSSLDFAAGRSCESLRTVVDTKWQRTVVETTTLTPRKDTLSRRASFCGVGSANGGEEIKTVWEGILPLRKVDGGGFSPKVFLGGLPWDISEQSLMQALKSFYPVCIEWPGRVNTSMPGSGGMNGPRGFAYVTFESERRVRALLSAARRDGADWYYRVSSRNMKTKEVQVIPWSIADSSCVIGGSKRLDPARTVFVGALHGMLSAHALATIMNELFSGVLYAGIDTDKNRYPIGSGRVTFDNVHSYLRAIAAGFIEIRTDKFTKKVQVDPYLEDSMCSVCNIQQGPYFCREPVCFRYFCRSCWAWQHPAQSTHRSLMRSVKSNQLLPANISNNGNGNMAMCNGIRQSPQIEQSSIMNGGFGAANDLTPSPPTSGSSDHVTEETSDW